MRDLILAAAATISIVNFAMPFFKRKIACKTLWVKDHEAYRTETEANCRAIWYYDHFFAKRNNFAIICEVKHESSVYGGERIVSCDSILGFTKK